MLQRNFSENKYSSPTSTNLQILFKAEMSQKATLQTKRARESDVLNFLNFLLGEQTATHLLLLLTHTKILVKAKVTNIDQTAVKLSGYVTKQEVSNFFKPNMPYLMVKRL